MLSTHSGKRPLLKPLIGCRFVYSHLAPWLNLSFLQITQLESLDFWSRNPVFSGLLIMVQDLSLFRSCANLIARQGINSLANSESPLKRTGLMALSRF